MNAVSRALLLVLTVVVAAACAVPVPLHAPGAALENTTWKLVELGGQPVRAARNIAAPSLMLDPAQIQARGSTGCNTFFGRYELAAERLRFGPLASTRRACLDPDMNRQEAAFLKALGETRGWRIGSDTLSLRGETAELARFAAQSAK